MPRAYTLIGYWAAVVMIFVIVIVVVVLNGLELLGGSGLVPSS